MALVLSVVDDARALAGLAPEWNQLLARSTDDQVMRGPDWLLPWWDVFGDDERRLRVITLRARDRLVGLVPLLARRVRHAPGLRLDRLEALGTGEAEADEVVSEYTGPVVERGAEHAVAEAVAEAVDRGRAGACHELVFARASVGRADLDALAEAFGRRGWRAERGAPVPSPYVPLPGSFEDYLKALPQQRRYQVKKALRALGDWSGGKHELRVASDAASLDAGLAVLRDLHGERWADAGRAGVFASPRFTRFLGLAATRLLDAGALELLWLDTPEGPLAAVLNLVHGDRVVFYQSGRRTDVPPKLRPGVIIHALAMQRAIARGLREYDFMGGTQRYKAELALAEHTLADWRVARPGWRETARAGHERARDQLRRARDELRRRWQARRGDANDAGDAAGAAGDEAGAKPPGGDGGPAGAPVE